MDQIQIFSLLVLVMLLQNCATTKNNVFWVSGIKTECTAGAGKMQCLNVHKGEDISNPNWENFYAPIKGFEFEEGYLQKIEVKEIQLDKSEVPADGSSIRYELVKVLDKQKDIRAELNGYWTLARLNEAPLNSVVAVPTMTIDLSKKLLTGNGGCNNFTVKIQSLTNSKITLGSVAETKKACINKNVEAEFQEAVNSIKTYVITGDGVTFIDESGKKVIEFIKGEPNKPNQRLHDIWFATRIDGNPINRMSPIPRMEINLSEMKVFGNDGCNDYHGTVEELSDAEIVFGNIVSTNKMCRKMETTDNFNKALSKVKGYKLEHLSLILVDENGGEVLAFLKGD